LSGEVSRPKLDKDAQAIGAAPVHISKCHCIVVIVLWMKQRRK